jgi:signal transduction histidine kinase
MSAREPSETERADADRAFRGRQPLLDIAQLLGGARAREKGVRARYLAERDQVVLRHLRTATLVAGGTAILTSPLGLLNIEGEGWAAIVHATRVAVVSLAAFAVACTVLSERHAVPFAVAVALSLGGSLIWRGPLEGEPMSVFALGVGMVMIGAALLVPWGTGAQSVVSLGLTAWLLTAHDWQGLTHGYLPDALPMLVGAVVLSVAGAELVDRQRYRTFVEAEQTRMLARQQEFLVRAGQTLTAVLEEEELFPEIVRLFRDLIDCDQASLTLLSEDGITSRVVAIEGTKRLRIHEMLNVDVPIPPIFLAELDKRIVTEVPGESDLFNEGTYPVMQRFGVGRGLFVVLRRGERVLGYLNLDNVSPEPRFTPEQRTAAEALAHQTAIALTNARLVRDLQRANRAKVDFLSMMSHELRTPLHVIMGFNEMLGELVRDAEIEAACDAVQRIDRAGNDLLRLVDATLHVGRLDSGCDEPRIEATALESLWREAAAEIHAVAPPAVTAGEVRLWFAPVPDVTVSTDPEKLRIILRNLVGNALKFTRSGSVAVHCALQGETLVVEVRDTGIGIPAERLSSVFEMFEQGQGGDARSYGGVGLGLYIVRRLVDQLRGAIHVESELGRGSTFTVVLPIVWPLQPERAP